MSKNIPAWSKKVQKKMLDKGMKKIELARALHVNEKQLYSVMSGGVINETIAEKVCNYFGMER